MPIVKLEQINENQLFAIWKITESKKELLEQIILTNREQKEIDTIHNNQKFLECIGGKAAVQYLIENEGEKYEGLIKDDCSKRFLVNKEWHISISHSFPYAVAALNKKMPVGIDIEKPKEKVLKIRNKFLNAEENIAVGQDLIRATLYWSAKEALYKLYGRKKLIFKDNIKVILKKISPDKISPDIEAVGEININNQITQYELCSYCFEDYLIICTGEEIK